jgi:two-component system chemotaxis sensor kinase CheA
MDDMLKDFVVEAMDLAVNVEEHLLRLERDPDNKETLNAVFRSFHTIKGGAGFMGLPALVAACHLTENLFDALRTGAAPVTPLAIEAALQASGFVADQLNDLNNGATPEQLAPMPAGPRAHPEGCDRRQRRSGACRALRRGARLPAAVRRLLRPRQRRRPRLGSDVHGRGPAGHLHAGSRRSGAGAPAPPWRPRRRRRAGLPARRRRRQGRLGRRRPPRRRQAAQNAPAKDESIRIDAVKLDALLEVAGESVQAANQAAVLLERLSQFKFEGQAATLMATLTETLERASRYSAELQRATLATRMQPVGRLFQKFPRLVRELAKDLGKDVELTIEGAETEVDRVVVDSLYDPLVHMLRNALDHGVESPQDRVAAGKPAKAFILLKAWQEANSVMIVLQDDGRGMDPAKLRKKAIDKGLIGEQRPPERRRSLPAGVPAGLLDQGSGFLGLGPRRRHGRGQDRGREEPRRDPHRFLAGPRHQVRDPPADRTVDRADHAGLDLGRLAGAADGGGRARGRAAGDLHAGRRRPGAERPGPSAAGALAGGCRSATSLRRSASASSSTRRSPTSWRWKRSTARPTW